MPWARNNGHTGTAPSSALLRRRPRIRHALHVGFDGSGRPRVARQDPGAPGATSSTLAPTVGTKGRVAGSFVALTHNRGRSPTGGWYPSVANRSQM